MDGRIGVGLLVGGLAVAGALRRGSRTTDPAGITVVRVTPHRVGFAGPAVVRSLSRGKAHDPHAIDRVEVILGAADASALRDPRVLLDAARVAAQPYVHHGFARIVSGVYPSSHPMGPRHLVRVEVSR
jgi:hypothetical protein